MTTTRKTDDGKVTLPESPYPRTTLTVRDSQDLSMIGTYFVGEEMVKSLAGRRMSASELYAAGAAIIAQHVGSKIVDIY